MQIGLAGSADLSTNTLHPKSSQSYKQLSFTVFVREDLQASFLACIRVR